MSLKRTVERSLPILIVLSAVGVFLTPLFVRRLASDGPAALNWISAFSTLQRAGVLWPRWLPGTYAGLGSPTFYFYPPVAYFLSSGIRFVLPNESLLTTYLITAYLASGATVLSFYFLSSEFTSEPRPRILASLLYAFAPYHLFAEINRGGLAEHVGFIWPPLILYALLRIVRSSRPRFRDTLLGSVAIAMLLMTHVPSFIVVTIALILPVVVLNITKRIGWLVLMGVMAGLFAAPYVLPLLAHASDVQLARLNLDPLRPFDAWYSFTIITGHTDYSENAQILIGYFGIVMLAVSLAIYWRRTHQRIIILFVVISLVIIIFQNASISRSLWLLLGLNQSVQFLYRWLVVGCLVVAAAYAQLSTEASSWRLTPTILLWTMAAMGLSLFQMLGVRAHPYNVPWTPYEPAEYAPASAPPDKLAVIHWVSAHANDPFIAADSNVHVRSLEIGNLSYQDSLVITQPSRVALHHWYWPDWKPYLDGKPIVQYPDTNGRATIFLPAGRHLLIYRLEQSQSENVGWIIFWGNVVAVLSVSLLRRRSKLNLKT